MSRIRRPDGDAASCPGFRRGQWTDSRLLSQWGGSASEQDAVLRFAELEDEVERWQTRFGFSLPASGEMDSATEQVLRA